MKGCRTGSSHFGVYGVWLEVGLDGLSESAGVQQASSDVVVEVAEAEGYAPCVLLQCLFDRFGSVFP